MPLHVALYQPEIPPNTGNVIRLCANSGARLHLIRPLGFKLTDSRLKRAGLDYHEWASLSVHDTLDDCLEAVRPACVYGFTTHAQRAHSDAAFGPDDLLLFGPETRGLPEDVLTGLPPQQRLRVPMLASSRSLNLSNTVAIAVYEAWRQMGFAAGS